MFVATQQITITNVLYTCIVCISLVVIFNLYKKFNVTLIIYITSNIAEVSGLIKENYSIFGLDLVLF